MYFLLGHDGDITPLPDSTGRDVMAALVTGELGGIVEVSDSFGRFKEFRVVADDVARLKGRPENPLASALIGESITGSVIVVRSVHGDKGHDLPLTVEQQAIVRQLADQG